MSVAVAITADRIRETNAVSASKLSTFERICLAVGIAEIPLQLDKYFMFHEADAELGAVGGFVISVTSIAIFMLYGSWLSTAAVQREPVRRRWNFGVPMLVYLGTVAISAASAQLFMLTMFDLFLLTQSFLLFFYLANKITTRDDLFFCISCLAITVIMQSCFIFGLSAMGSSAIGREFNVGPIVFAVWDDGRPAGTMQSAVLAGSTLALMWLPCVAVFLVSAPKYAKRICTTAAAMGIVAVFLTQTRGAILSSILGLSLLGVSLFFRGMLPRWTVPAAVLLCCVLVFPTVRLIENRFTKGDTGSAGSRIHLTAIAFEMISDRPLQGFGAGNCHLAGQRFADQAKYRALWYFTIHCKYLLVWIETGLIGLVAFLAVLTTSIGQALRGWFCRDKVLAPIGLAIAAAILGHMLHMFVDIFNSRSQVQMLWVVFGIAAAVWRLSFNPIRTDRIVQGGLHAS